MTKHKQIWKNYNGKIPKDELGRPYDVHHINGNRKDNRIENLQCLSMRDHYELHMSKGDWADAYRVAKRLGLMIDEPIDLLSWTNKKRLEKGTHPFQMERVRKKAAVKVKERVDKGIQGLQDVVNLQQAHRAKSEKYSSSDLSLHIKKGWETYRENNPGNERVQKGLEVAHMKIRGTKWYHKLDGSLCRMFPDDLRIELEGWLIGKFKKISDESI